MAVSDSFDRADQSLDADGHWSELEGNCAIESNKARESDGSTGYHWATYTGGVTWGPDQSSQAVITLDQDDALIVNAANNGGLDGYHGMIHGVNGFRIYRRDDGGFTLLHDGAGTPVSDRTFKLGRSGAQLTLYENGVSKSTASDSTYLAGAPGISPRFSGSRYDDWVGAGESGAGESAARLFRNNLRPRLFAPGHAR